MSKVCHVNRPKIYICKWIDVYVPPNEAGSMLVLVQSSYVSKFSDVDLFMLKLYALKCQKGLNQILSAQ